jgi:hypothetical protein
MVHKSGVRWLKELIFLRSGGAALVALSFPDLGYFFSDVVVQLFVQLGSVTECKQNLQVDKKWCKNHG